MDTNLHNSLTEHLHVPTEVEIKDVSEGIVYWRNGKFPVATREEFDVEITSRDIEYPRLALEAAGLQMALDALELLYDDNITEMQEYALEAGRASIRKSLEGLTGG